MTVRRLLADLDSYELSEWMAFFEVEGVDQKQATAMAEAKAEVVAKRKGKR